MNPRERPSEIPGTTYRVPVIVGTAELPIRDSIYVTVTLVDNRPFEVFGSVSRSGTGDFASLEALCRMVSLWLRSGGSVNDVVRHLAGISSGLGVAFNGSKEPIRSVPDAIAGVLKKWSEVTTGE